MVLGLEPLSFVSIEKVKRLSKLLRSFTGDQAQEFNQLRDDFTDPAELVRCYVEPHLQSCNPFSGPRESYFPVPRESAFSLLNRFLDGGPPKHRDGSSQLFLLADAGMGKSSLLLIIKLMQLAGLWPSCHHCLLLRLDENTLEYMAAVDNKSETILLLDALNEDHQARERLHGRLSQLLRAGAKFRRVIITCRTHFFPEVESDSSGRVRLRDLSGYNCPILYLSPFNARQERTLIRNKISRNTKKYIGFQGFGASRRREQATLLLAKMRKMRMRPILLGHIETLLEINQQRNWNAYTVYEALVQQELDRQLLRLKDDGCVCMPKRVELFHAFVRLARWMEEKQRIEIAEKDLWELFCEDANVCWLEKFKPDHFSLLNKTSKQVFRFSHSTFQEFLLAYALVHDGRPFPAPVRATEQLVRFLDLSGEMSPHLQQLDLRAFNPFRYVDAYGTLFSWKDRLGRAEKRLLRGPEMVMLPGGRFRMGDIQGTGASDARPAHEVELDSFAFSRYPVTFEEYDLFCISTERDRPKDNGWGRKQRPVFNVSWQDANNYCDWLRQTTNQSYRLPTEAEWEYACRAGSQGMYCFGDEKELLEKYAWYAKNAEGKTHPVGEKQANNWGFYDMHGNVWEWCADRYDQEYYTDQPIRNPASIEQGAGRVLRGGSWDSGEKFIHSSFRFCLSPGLRIIRVGFRVALGNDI